MFILQWKLGVYITMGSGCFYGNEVSVYTAMGDMCLDSQWMLGVYITMEDVLSENVPYNRTGHYRWTVFCYIA